MPDAQLTSEELYVLSSAADDFGAFTFLAWLGSHDHQPQVAATATKRLLSRGLVSIEASSDASRSTRQLDSDEALKSISDERKWRDPRREPFADDETYYLVCATSSGLQMLEVRGWQPS